jgi:TonB family protein
MIGRAHRFRALAALSSLLAVGLGSAGNLAFAQGAVPNGASGASPTAPKQAAGPTGTLPPVLTQFVEATYPEEARKKNLEGTVILELDISSQGKVTSVLVINPAGHGFDEAAVDAARKFVFQPAKQGGKNVAARIRYRYVFTQKLVDPKKGPGSKGGPQVKKGPQVNLSGVLKIAGSDQALANGEVTVTDSSGKTVGQLVTKEDGKWEFNDLPPGKYQVQVKVAGYNTVKVEEEVVPKKITEVVYRMTSASEIGVVVQGKRPPREVTRRTIEQRELSRIPGTNGDALRSLQNLPGVARPPGLAGLLIVRGSAPQDTNVFIDGTFVPLVYHFGGLSSVVPTEMIEQLDFYPGNFSTQYGRVTGGIVDVKLRGAKKDGKYHGMAQADFIDARFVLEGPVPFLKNWTFIAAARRSYVDVWLKPALESAGAGVTSAPVYYDYQLFVETRPTPRSKFRLGLFGSDDRLELLIKEPPANAPIIGGNIGLFTGFWRTQAVYTNDISDDLRFSGMLSYGFDHFNINLGSLYFDLGTHFITHRAELSYKVSKGVTVNVGQDIFLQPYDISIRLPPPPRPGEPSSGPFAGRPPLTLTESGSIYRPAAYAEVELAPSKRARIVSGIRMDYAKDTARWDPSPRVNGRYNIVHEFPRTTIKGGVGVFHAPPQPQEVANVFGTPGIRSNRAIHYSAGMEQELTRHVEVSLEGFYKQLDSLVTRNPTANGSFEYNNQGSGYVVGSELLLRYKPDKRFFGWLAYTLMRSTRQNGPDQPTQLFQYDQTHILTALGSYRLGRGWEFGARFRLVSGPLQTPCVGSLYNSSSGSYACYSGSPFSQRLPTYNQLDLRIDKRWVYKYWKMSMYLDILNVYNRQNPEANSYNFNYSLSTYQTGLPIIPSFGIRGEF